MTVPEAPSATSDTADGASAGPVPDEADGSAPDGSGTHGGDRLGRATTTITIWNLVSRLTGFVRVLVTASALGIAVLGDTYQRTNQVSNVLFELLAGGMLFSVLVPSFVEELRLGERDGARQLAGALATRGVAALGVVVAAGMLLARPITDLLTANADATTRAAQAQLGAILLLFVLPQLLFYVVGAVASGLLQADHRFAATSAAPALNNLVVIATMVAFRAIHDPARGLDLTGGEQLLLGGGTLLGTVAMTVVPLWALRRAGLGIRPRWKVDHDGLGALARRGLWGAGHVGLNQILVMTTVVLAGSVQGGVIAYQTAFTFFLLPHALLAHPIFTALYPRLAREGAARSWPAFAGNLARGLRSITFLLLPASALLAVVAPPALSVLHYGQLDADGTRMVSLALAAYLAGLTGYSTFFLLTRASYAVDDARLPTLVNLGITVVTIAGMVVVGSVVEGTAVLVGFGVVTSVVATAGSIVLHLVVRRRIDQPIVVFGSIARSSVAAALSAVSGVAVTAAIGWDDTLTAVLSVGAATAVMVVVGVVVLRLLGSDELDTALARARRLTGRFAR